MVLNDPLASALSKIRNYEEIGRKECVIKPCSKLIKKVFDILNTEGYLGKYVEVEDGKGNYLNLNLIGKINRCGAVKPRFSVSIQDFEKFEKRFLPAKDFGLLIVSTSKGLMSHKLAKKNDIGGKIIAYCY